jgi:hypothetical protein
MSNPVIQTLAPSWLPRHQRRLVDKALNKLVEREACSVCGANWPHNRRTAYGLDSSGGIVVTGECCLDRVVVAFGYGFFSERRYDFLNPPQCSSRRTLEDGPGVSPARRPETNDQIAEAIALYQKAIAAADRQLESIERHGGIEQHGGVERHGDVEITGEALLLLDHPWKTDDRLWFEGNPKRSHRVRMPFTGEFDELGANAPAGHALIILVRQVKPGTRARHGFYLNADLIPVPNDEAIAHVLFDVATRREPMPRNGWALNALIAKYAACSSC